MAVKEHDDQHYSNQGMRERLLRQRRNRLKPKLRRSKNTVTVRGQRSGKEVAIELRVLCNLATSVGRSCLAAECRG